MFYAQTSQIILIAILTLFLTLIKSLSIYLGKLDSKSTNELTSQSNDPIVLKNICSSLFCYLPGKVDQNVCNRLVVLVSPNFEKLPSVQMAAIKVIPLNSFANNDKTLSNVIRYDDLQLKLFLKFGLVANLIALLRSSNSQIRVLACDALILLAGLKGEIQPLIQVAQIYCGVECD